MVALLVATLGVARRALGGKPSAAVWNEEIKAAWTQAYASAQGVPANYDIDEIEGRIPSALRGTVFRNGPGNFERGGQRYEHVLDGDGLLCRWSLDGATGRARFASRFVRTPEYAAEEAADTVLHRNTFGTQPASGPLGELENAFDLVLKNPANTNVQSWGGKLLALWEAALPCRIDPDTLEYVGRETFDGLPRDCAPSRAGACPEPSRSVPSRPAPLSACSLLGTFSEPSWSLLGACPLGLLPDGALTVASGIGPEVRGREQEPSWSLLGAFLGPPVRWTRASASASPSRPTRERTGSEAAWSAGRGRRHSSARPSPSPSTSGIRPAALCSPRRPRRCPPPSRRTTSRSPTRGTQTLQPPARRAREGASPSPRRPRDEVGTSSRSTRCSSTSSRTCSASPARSARCEPPERVGRPVRSPRLLPDAS